MRQIQNVHGSEECAKPLIIGKDTVYVHYNIRQETISDGIEDRIEWVYDEIQYGKDEYIKVISEKSNELENTINDINTALIEAIGGVRK